MQVRYQAAPRPDRNLDNRSAAQYSQHFFQFQAHLSHDLLALADVGSGLVTAKLVARAADRKPLFIQQAANLTDDDHVLALVVASIAASLDGLELRELLLPIAQHVRFHTAQFAD